MLQTLAERLPRGEARHILAELPAELKPWVYTEADAEGFGIDEFLERVARREDTDIETALAELLRRVAGRESADVDEAGLVDVVFKHVRAVFATLAEAVDAEEWFDMIAARGIQRAHPGTFGLRRGAPRSGQR